MQKTQTFDSVTPYKPFQGKAYYKKMDEVRLKRAFKTGVLNKSRDCACCGDPIAPGAIVSVYYQEVGGMYSDKYLQFQCEDCLVASV